MKKISIAVLSLIGSVTMSEIAQAQTNSWNLSRDMMISIATNPTTPTAPATAAWGFMENVTFTKDPIVSSNYTLLDAYRQPCFFYSNQQNPKSFNCWQHDPGQEAELNTVGITATGNVDITVPFFGKTFTVLQGMPVIIPNSSWVDNAGQAIVSWKSPIAGKVKMLGRITDIDPFCGNGISWKIVKDKMPINNGLLGVKPWAVLPNSGANSFYVPSVTVNVGTQLYFVVDQHGTTPLVSDLGCDETSFDLLIEKL